jgi:hypothetical protein
MEILGGDFFAAPGQFIADRRKRVDNSISNLPAVVREKQSASRYFPEFCPLASDVHKASVQSSDQRSIAFKLVTGVRVRDRRALAPVTHSQETHNVSEKQK